MRNCTPKGFEGTCREVPMSQQRGATKPREVPTPAPPVPPAVTAGNPAVRSEQPLPRAK